MAKVPATVPEGILAKLGKHLKWVDEPFDKSGNLLKDIAYQTGKKGSKAKYVYTTDSAGRLKTAHAHPLILDKFKRARHNPKTPGKQPGDQAGHLIADIFGGSGKLDNLVSQSSSINKSEMRSLEIKWEKLLSKTPPADVRLDIEVVYGDGARPTGFKITEFVDGRRLLHRFDQ